MLSHGGMTFEEFIAQGEAAFARSEAAAALQKPETLFGRVKFFFDSALKKFRRPANAPARQVNEAVHVQVASDEEKKKKKRKRGEDAEEKRKKPKCENRKRKSDDEQGSPRPVKKSRPTPSPQMNGMVDRATPEPVKEKTTHDIGVQTSPIAEPVALRKTLGAPRNDSAIDLSSSAATPSTPSYLQDPSTAKFTPEEIRRIERSVKRAAYSESVAAAKDKQRSSTITTDVASAKDKQQSPTTTTVARLSGTGALKTKSPEKTPAPASSRIVIGRKTKVGDEGAEEVSYLMSDGTTADLPRGCIHLRFDGQKPVIQRTEKANLFEIHEFLRFTKAKLAPPPKKEQVVEQTEQKPEERQDTGSSMISSTMPVAVQEPSASQEAEAQGPTSTQAWEARRREVQAECESLLAEQAKKQPAAVSTALPAVVEIPTQEVEVQKLEREAIEAPKQVASIPALLPHTFPFPATEPVVKQPMVDEAEDNMDGIQYAPTIVVSLIAKDLPVNVPAQIPVQPPQQMSLPMALPAPIAPTVPFPLAQIQTTCSHSFQDRGFGSMTALTTDTASPMDIEPCNPFLTGKFESTTASKNAPLGLGNSMLKPKTIPEDMEVDDSWALREKEAVIETQKFAGYDLSSGYKLSEGKLDTAIDDLIQSVQQEQAERNASNGRYRRRGGDAQKAQSRPYRWGTGRGADAGYEGDADTEYEVNTFSTQRITNSRSRNRRTRKNGRKGTEAGLTTPRGLPTTAYCRAFARNGRCRFGNNCKYSHQTSTSRTRIAAADVYPTTRWDRIGLRVPPWGCGAEDRPRSLQRATAETRRRTPPMQGSDTEEDTDTEALQRTLKAQSSIFRPPSLMVPPQSVTFRPQSPIFRPQSPIFRPQSPIFRPQSPIFRPQSPIFRPESPLFIPENPEDLPEYQESDEEPRGRTFNRASNPSPSSDGARGTTDSYRPSYRPSWQWSKRPTTGSTTEEDTGNGNSGRGTSNAPVQVSQRNMMPSSSEDELDPTPAPRPKTVRFGEQSAKTRPTPAKKALTRSPFLDSDSDDDDEL
ncbi:uncharacterized protein EI97DRAFT_443333 [Westerdykella ornata]|uniref:C3H1-type domain-containing protein n=1 Tax=Westerdykella ornata TaxID=318751 RepID=A0A6A6JHQ6_WESOR|nr:uncharacterized protein EI97DRAFT_443333 [Westerdykella ornata]KAF2275488.1 hypothetical protein EI97DRAFT_443333 [Westerdykella ornata]